MTDRWIRVVSYLPARPVAKRLAVHCKGDTQKAAGVLIDFWSSAAEFSKHGFIRDELDGTLEDWAKWKGKKGVFAAWVRAEHMDADGRIPEWDDYMGALETRREKDRKRQAERRQRRRESSGCHADGHADVTRDVTGGVTRNVRGSSAPPRANGTGRDGTGQEPLTIPDSQSPLPPVRRRAKRAASEPPEHWVREAAEFWREKVGVVTEGHIGGVLKPLVAAHGWPVVRAALEVYVSPDEGAKGARKPRWFAEAFQHWRLLSESPLVGEGGVLTDRGKRFMGASA